MIGRVAVPLCTAATLVAIGPALFVANAAASTPASAWTLQHSGVTADLEGVSFTDAIFGHAVGRGGAIIATVDGGRTWRQQFACHTTTPCARGSSDRMTNDLLAVSFVDREHGWATGASGTILGTSDGGATWQPELACAQTSAAIVRAYCTPLSADRITKDLTSVSFVDSTHGWAVGRGETILHTEDGGHTWVLQIACLWRRGGTAGPCPPRPSNPPPRDLFGVSFVDAAHGTAVGAAGYAFFTTDGGQTWSGGPSEVALDLHTVDTIVSAYDSRPMTVHAAGEGGQVLVAGARGLTWYGSGGADDQLSGQVPPTNQDLNGISFTDRLNGWAVGGAGTIASTHDEGVTWTADQSGTIATLHGVSFPDANHGFAVGDTGILLAYRARPAGLDVTGVSPRALPVDGRLPVTITGHGFTGAAEVSFGKAWAQGFTVDSDRQITAVPPSLPRGEVHVTVSAAGRTSQIGDGDAVTFAPTGGGAWTDAGSCPSRCNGAAVRLNDGRVLILGERWGFANASAFVELYDPSSGTLRAASPMRQARWDATATVLADGRVLVAGGEYAVNSGLTTVLGTAELYDPRTGLWTLTGSLHNARAEAAATLLPDGEVLLAGGDDVERKASLASVEIYNPATGKWRDAAPMHDSRSYDTALLLRTGQVLVAGSLNVPEDGSAELYDPKSNTWQDTGSMPMPVGGPNLMELNDGMVLASGGQITPPNRPIFTVPFAQVYNPVSGAWRATGPMLYPRVFHAAAVLPDGRVLVAGGLINQRLYCPPCSPLSQAEVYDPSSGGWQAVASMSQPEEAPSLVPLANGTVLMAGSDGHVAVFTPAAAPGASTGLDKPWILAIVGGTILSVIAVTVVLWRSRRWRRTPPRRTVRAAAGPTARRPRERN